MAQTSLQRFSKRQNQKYFPKLTYLDFSTFFYVVHDLATRGSSEVCCDFLVKIFQVYVQT